MRTPDDITGHRFGCLLALRLVRCDDGAIWLFRCDCGNEFERRPGALRYEIKKTVSKREKCGCRGGGYRHGISYTRIYKIWEGMKKRCYGAYCRSYPDYGGRGIYICPEWLADPMSFYRWALAHGYAPDLTIERNDANGPYSPENCRWATRAEQNQNTRQSRKLTFRGETKTLAQWGREVGIKASTIGLRIRTGWPVEQALTVPAFHGRNNRSLA